MQGTCRTDFQRNLRQLVMEDLDKILSRVAALPDGQEPSADDAGALIAAVDKYPYFAAAAVALLRHPAGESRRRASCYRASQPRPRCSRPTHTSDGEIWRRMGKIPPRGPRRSAAGDRRRHRHLPAYLRLVQPRRGGTARKTYFQPHSRLCRATCPTRTGRTAGRG